MAISKDDVIYTSKLARIAIDEDKVEDLTQDMSNIVKFVEKINECPTDDVEPLANVLDITDVNRPDEPGDSLPSEKIEELAPKFRDGHIIVPPVIE